MKALALSLTFIAVGIAFGQPPGGNQPPGKPAPGAKPKADPKAKPKLKDPLVVKITTQTGQGNKNAGTSSSKIYVLFNGDPEKKFRLTNKSKPFQRGATDKFELKIDLDPSTIESVRLVNESPDMWKCETITFQFFKGGKESRIIRLSPAQYLSSEAERKALHAKPHVDLKLKVTLEEPKAGDKSEQSEKSEKSP